MKENSAGGVVIKDGKILLLKKFFGDWVLPKGKIEKEETTSITALREVREESGVEARIQKKLGWIQYEFYHRGRSHNKKVLWFKMKKIGGQLAPLRQEGFVDLAFFTLEELPTQQMHENEVLMIKKAFDA